MHALHAVRVAWDVYSTAVGEEWILGLDDDNYTAMLAAIELLEVHGPSSGGRLSIEGCQAGREDSIKAGSGCRGDAEGARRAPIAPVRLVRWVAVDPFAGGAKPPIAASSAAVRRPRRRAAPRSA